jgi:hypothetical protein
VPVSVPVPVPAAAPVPVPVPVPAQPTLQSRLVGDVTVPPGTPVATVRTRPRSPDYPRLT